MAYGEYESYYIKEEELKMLLAGLGMQQWYGLTSNSRRKQEKEKNKEDIFRLLTSLYQKEYIEWSNEKVEILEPVASLVMILKKAHHCIQIEVSGENDFLLGCYAAPEGIILLEKSQREPDMLRFSQWEETGFVEHLKECGIFPEIETFVGKVIFSLRESHSGLEEARMTIAEEGLYPFLFLWEGFEAEKKEYQQQECEKLLRGWIHREAQI
jgi:hypothetical protein